MYSDRLTLTSASSLWRSQYSKGPKKFQFGPRRKVPRTISERPQDQEAEQEERDLDLALVEGVVAVALRVRVDVGDGHEARR